MSRVRWTPLLAIVVAVLVLVLAACGPVDRTTAGGGGGDRRGGNTITIGADADPIGLDPTTTAAFSSFDFMALIYSGLLRWNSDMEIETDLATSYEQTSPTTYVFQLREGVTFHNGKEFSADDVKYTFERIKDPDTGSPRQAVFGSIKEITVDNPTQVTFELTGPDAAFLSFLASTPDGAIVPRGVEDLDNAPVGTGPFKFESYRPNQQLTLVANPDYYEEGLPRLDAVEFRFFRDQSSLTAALRSRAIDMTWFKNPKVAANVAKTSPDVVSAPGQNSRVFPVWLTMDEGPLADVRVRRAMSLAIDRQVAVQSVLSGSGKLGMLVPDSQLGGIEDGSDLPYYQRDVAEAKRLLAEAGYPDGIDLGEYKVVAANDLDVQTAQILQQQWAEAGITVHIRPMETAPLLEQWQSGDFGLLSVSRTTSTWDPDSIISTMASTSPSAKSMGLDDPKLDQMIADARAEQDEARRAERYQEIQRHIADRAYLLSIYQYPLRWEMWWDDILGYEAMPTNIRTYLRTAWVDK